MRSAVRQEKAAPRPRLRLPGPRQKSGSARLHYEGVSAGMHGGLHDLCCAWISHHSGLHALALPPMRGASLQPGLNAGGTLRSCLRLSSVTVAGWGGGQLERCVPTGQTSEWVAGEQAAYGLDRLLFGEPVALRPIKRWLSPWLTRTGLQLCRPQESALPLPTTGGQRLSWLTRTGLQRCRP